MTKATTVDNDKMTASVLALPLADLMMASKIYDPIGACTYYRADTVVRLLAAERERCAKVCESVAEDLENAEEEAQALSTGAQSCADQIRAGA